MSLAHLPSLSVLFRGNIFLESYVFFLNAVANFIALNVKLNRDGFRAGRIPSFTGFLRSTLRTLAQAVVPHTWKVCEQPSAHSM